MFCFRITSFVHSRSGTYYALLLGCFGLKFLLDVHHCVCGVWAEIWALDSSHNIGHKFFIQHCQDWKEGSFVFETVWCFSLVNTHPFDLKFVAFCPKFSRDSYVEFQEKTISGWFFRNFVQTKAIPYQNLSNFALLSVLLFWVRIPLKKFTQVLSYVVCTQVRRHIYKKITKRRYGEEKPRRFVFGKPVLFTLGLGLTTPYSLGLFVWNFYQTFVTCLLSFAEIWALDSSHNIDNKFFIHHCQGWKEGSFVCETVWYFSWVNTHPFDLKFVALCPKFSGDSYVEFQEKTFSGVFFRNFVQTKVISTKTCEISPYFLQFYSGSVLRCKNSHKYFHMLFAAK